MYLGPNGSFSDWQALEHRAINNLAAAADECRIALIAHQSVASALNRCRAGGAARTRRTIEAPGFESETWSADAFESRLFKLLMDYCTRESLERRKKTNLNYLRVKL